MGSFVCLQQQHSNSVAPWSKGKDKVSATHCAESTILASVKVNKVWPHSFSAENRAKLLFIRISVKGTNKVWLNNFILWLRSSRAFNFGIRVAVGILIWSSDSALSSPCKCPERDSARPLPLRDLGGLLNRMLGGGPLAGSNRMGRVTCRFY